MTSEDLALEAGFRGTLMLVADNGLERKDPCIGEKPNPRAALAVAATQRALRSAIVQPEGAALLAICLSVSRTHFPGTVGKFFKKLFWFEIRKAH